MQFCAWYLIPTILRNQLPIKSLCSVTTPHLEQLPALQIFLITGHRMLFRFSWRTFWITEGNLFQCHIRTKNNCQMMVNGSLPFTVLLELQPSLSCLSLSRLSLSHKGHTPLTHSLDWLPLDSETAWSVHTHWTWLTLVALPSSSWLTSLGTSPFLHHLPCTLLQRCWYSHCK